MSDQKNLILAIALSILIILGFQVFYEGPRQQGLQSQRAEETAAVTPSAAAPGVQAPAAGPRSRARRAAGDGRTSLGRPDRRPRRLFAPPGPLDRRGPRTGRSAVSPLAHLLRGLVHVYRWTLSPILGANCRFEPSCSLYGHQAIEHLGLVPGLVLFGARLMRAHLNADRFYRFDGARLLDPLDDTLDWLTPREDHPRWYWRSSVR